LEWRQQHEYCGEYFHFERYLLRDGDGFERLYGQHFAGGNGEYGSDRIDQSVERYHYL
jgi:hypothetical protein